MRRDSCTARTGVATGRLRLAVPALGALLLVACGGDVPPAPGPLPDPGLATEIVTLRTVPVERQLDGIVEAVDQATIAAQTAGRVAEILYDVNDAVPAGAVLVRLRSTEQRAGLAQAEAGLAA
ncbi:MAG: biotin/lipoyl-binding protein, partial [Gammaproteobacteria bacterium]|nr:biotin/lipoyl-binding protein [Gammaproteobacteria bacterium]